ncbi:hypothetical protein [Deinococcus sp. QL22]|uniref:hypothetical protein n=1 Tax=Deinococcus sp. QL22 TaxID=2939437 RepID=UPI002017ED4B|nr:hypothetical protein [Deinococcus sp. QL22]UQN10299.1 hypothetical protein M1R55_29550 [Deinococcus sp. QL22]UQN10433.1 hypothetical protein M1R55_28875 [Deinococcus sp. QL22]
MSPTRILRQTRNVTVSEADNIIKRHAQTRKMNPRICKSALDKDGLDTAEGLLRQDAGRYFLSTPGRGA